MLRFVFVYDARFADALSVTPLLMTQNDFQCTTYLNNLPRR